MQKSIVIAIFSQRGLKKARSLIAKKLGDNSHNRVVIIGKERYAAEEFPDGIILRCFDDYLEDQADHEIKDSVATLMRSLPQQENFARATDYGGVSLWDIIAYPVFRHLFEMARYIRVVENIIDREQPEEIIIVGDRGTSLFWLNTESGLAERSNLRRIASLVVNSRRETLGEKVFVRVARHRKIAVSRISHRRLVYLPYRLAGSLLPVFFKYFSRYRDWRRKTDERKYRSSGTASSPPQSKICFFVSSRNEVMGMAPVIKELERNGQTEVLVIRADGLLNNFAQKALEREGITYKTYETYIDGKVKKKATSGAKSLARKWRQLKADESFRQTLSYRGIPLWEILHDDLSDIFTTLLPQIIKHVETIRRIIETEGPGVIVIGDETSILGGSAALVSKLYDIPTLDVENGAGIGETVDTPIPASILRAVDRMAVWGEAMRNSAIKGRKIPPDRIVVTGSPGFDYMRKTVRDFNKEEFCRQLGLAGDRSTVLFTSQPVQLPITLEIREQLIYCVYQTMKKLPDRQFVVKLHPGEGFDRHHQLRQEMELENVVITKDTNLYHLFAICDLVLTCASTTALEAMIMDKPVLDINLAGLPDVLPYAQSGAAIGVYRLEDLVPAIMDVMDKEEVRLKLAEKRRRFVYDYTYLQDGHAAERVADLVTQMAMDSRKEKVAPGK